MFDELNGQFFFWYCCKTGQKALGKYYSWKFWSSLSINILHTQIWSAFAVPVIFIEKIFDMPLLMISKALHESLFNSLIKRHFLLCRMTLSTILYTAGIISLLQAWFTTQMDIASSLLQQSESIEQLALNRAAPSNVPIRRGR